MEKTEIPLFKRIFVFAVRKRSRLVTKSGIYVPNSSRGTHTRAEDVWVLRPALDCILGPWKMGQHILLADGIELQDGIEFVDGIHIWDKYKNEPSFAQLKKFSEDCEGKVESFVIHEDSVLGEVLGDLFQDDLQW